MPLTGSLDCRASTVVERVGLDDGWATDSTGRTLASGPDKEQR